MRCIFGWTHQLGDAEVENLDPPVLGDEQILRLHVPVNDVLVVRRRETFRDLTRIVDGPPRRQRTAM